LSDKRLTDKRLQALCDEHDLNIEQLPTEASDIEIDGSNHGDSSDNSISLDDISDSESGAFQYLVL